MLLLLLLQALREIVDRMRAVIWLSVLCGIALATPPTRQRRAEEGQQKQKAAEHPGLSELEVLTVPVYKETFSDLFGKMKFAERHTETFLWKAAGLFSDLNEEKFKSLVSEWHTLKPTVLGTFDSVAGILATLSKFLYDGDTKGFNETRRCDHLKEFIQAEGMDPNMKDVLEGIRETTKCFLDILKEASNPNNFEDCDSLTEKQAIGVIFHLVQALHPLKLNGARALTTVEQLIHKITQADKSKEENQGSSPGGQGGQVATDKRIVELLRRYLELEKMKRGPSGQGGKGSGGSSGQGKDGSGSNKSGENGKTSGESSKEDDKNKDKDAGQQKPGPYTREEFSKNIEDVIKIVQGIMERFIELVGKMEKQDLTDKEVEELMTKWTEVMHSAGSGIDMAMIYLGGIIHRLYLNTDIKTIKEVNLCDLKIATFSHTITDEQDQKQIMDFAGALAKTVVDDAICIREQMDEEAKLRSRLVDCSDSVPEDVAMRLIEDAFKHLHQVRVTVDRFFRHIERAAQPLVKIFMPDEKRELREMETELMKLMKKELAAHS